MTKLVTMNLFDTNRAIGYGYLIKSITSEITQLKAFINSRTRRSKNNKCKSQNNI
jgi:hypothetical protein